MISVHYYYMIIDQRVCEQPEGPSTALTYTKGAWLGNAAFCSQQAQPFL